MGERTWSRSCWTAPALLVWQLVPEKDRFPPLMEGIACATALCRLKRQSAAQAAAGWANRKAARVARAKHGERRAWGIRGVR
jgi:hypothetical protein